MVLRRVLPFTVGLGAWLAGDVRTRLPGVLAMKVCISDTNHNRVAFTKTHAVGSLRLGHDDRARSRAQLSSVAADAQPLREPERVAQPC